MRTATTDKSLTTGNRGDSADAALLAKLGVRPMTGGRADAGGGGGGIMPTILRIEPFRFYFYSHEPNEPPHVHVDRDEATIKVWLDEIAVAKSRGFRAHEINDILGMVDEHRERLLEAWHEYFG